MTAYFTLKHRQRKRDGKHNIMLTVQDRTKKKRFSTKIYVEKKYFQNKHNAWIKKSHRDSHYLNSSFGGILSGAPGHGSKRFHPDHGAVH